MDLGISQGIYTNTPNGVVNGIYTSTNTGINNGIYNENTLYNKIIKNGLVLNYNVGFYQSYPKNGTTIFDLTTNNLNGTLTNSPIFKQLNRGILQYNGINTYIKLPNNPLLSFTDFTLSSWINTSTLNTNQFITDTSTDAGNGNGYSYRITSTNKIRFWAYSASYLLDSINTISSNIWYNITVSYNNITRLQTIYINGIYDNSGLQIGFAASNVANLWIGGSNIFGLNFNGFMAQHLFYNRTLSASEILQNFLATKSIFNL